MFKIEFILCTQSLVNEEGEMAPFDLATSAEWTPFAYTSACEALKDFVKEAKKAPESKPFLTDLETIFEVRHSWGLLAM